MKEFELPALEYCSLERASRYLGCEVQDLLHWAELRAIPMMVRFKDNVDGRARLSFSDKVDLYRELNSIDPGNGEFQPSALSSFFLSPDDFSDYEFEGIIKPVHNMIEFNLECRLGGIWEIVNFNLDNNGVDFSLLKPFRNRCEWLDTAFYWNGSDFNINQLLISKESLEIISGVAQKRLRSIANYEDAIPQEYGEESNQKTKNYRAMFIKRLLQVCYGDDVANNPRKFIENPRSEISIAFGKHGIQLPSGKAIENWLKDVD